jgi:hypothetical protein
VSVVVPIGVVRVFRDNCVAHDVILMWPVLNIMMYLPKSITQIVNIKRTPSNNHRIMYLH